MSESKTVPEFVLVPRSLLERARAWFSPHSIFGRALIRDIDAAMEATPPDLAAVRELVAELKRADAFIAGIADDLLSQRTTDWFPEGADNAANCMSDAMRSTANACRQFDVSKALAHFPEQQS